MHVIILITYRFVYRLKAYRMVFIFTSAYMTLAGLISVEDGTFNLAWGGKLAERARCPPGSGTLHIKHYITWNCI